jgi:hypothetical protein
MIAFRAGVFSLRLCGRQVTTWRRDGQMLTLSGGKTLRFRSVTN